jgi:ribosome-associated toxin RatA of RatAB toxin-antitoxin module
MPIVTSETPAPVRRTHHVRGAQPRELYDIVTDFPAYPRVFREMKSVRVVTVEGNRHRVEFRLEMVVAVRYTLDLVCDPAALTVQWSYVEGEVVTGSEGGWRFVPDGDGTRMEYQAALTIDAPLPGFVVRRVTQALVSASLPTMFAAIESELARRRQGPA